ncbi:PAS/PAC sensor hybrid histidine kinase [Burkholderia sp. YR290]|uniref:PAS domain S-box protein n=1 Tax=Paraburkholderia hospita TaxID=169430 RepID=UPI0009A7E44C|nr:PAS domain S-box protein [Paraburkholderia hospita]SKC99798.1 PAS/PAC sensor hybrid histidine kinase [Paraburkholderia hospita]SOE91132.1 PAS/PAC sensor hybrid histidine kinase [Burkholderia sp. YR290]
MNASQDRQIDTSETATQLNHERLANARLRKLIDAHSRIAAAKLDLDRFLSLVTDSLLELVPAAHASVVEWVDGDEMVYRACSGTIAHHIGLRLKRVGSLSGLCSLEKHLLYSSDTSDDPRVDAAACKRVGATSMVVAPLLYQSEVAGVVKLMASRTDAFSADDIETLERITSLVASGMAHQRVFAENRALIEQNTITIARLRTEISLREAADSKLEASLRRRRLVLDTTHDAFVCTDADGVIIEWNDAATRTFGYARDAMTGRPILDTLFPARCKARYAELDVFKSAPEQSAQTPSHRSRTELIARRIDGNEFPAELSVCPVQFDGHTELAYFIRDVTERFNARELDKRFRVLVDAIKDYAITMLDSHGHIMTWSAGSTQVMGYTPHEVIGQPAALFYTPEDIAAGRPQRDLELAAREGRVEMEEWRVRKNGTIFWANIITTALRDPNGALQGFAKITRDMSRRRRLEELEASSQRMSQFLALLGHELRNPLAPLRNAVSMLQLKTADHHAFVPEHELIDRQLSHLTRLVDDLLDAGRVTLGRVQIEPKPVSMQAIAQLSIEGSAPLLAAREQTLDVVLPDTPMTIKGDLTRMVQVVQNLLNNASKFSPAGASISLQVFRSGRLLAIRIHDSGRGIDPDAIDAIFNLFVQETPTEEQADKSGLGIGLTLARAIVDLHGGHIEAHSEGRGKGSVFTVWLPEFSHAIAAEAVREEAPVPSQPVDLKVMVVDDNVDSADSMATLVQVLGHEAHAVYDGAAAIELAQTLQPHLVLLDLSMPKMTGFEALPRIRKALAAPGAVIAAMTGLGTSEDRAKTEAAGFDLHLTKPVDLPELESVLQIAVTHVHD